MECIELNCLCKHVKKVRSSPDSILINSYTELSKTRLLPVSIVKSILTITENFVQASEIQYSLYNYRTI